MRKLIITALFLMLFSFKGAFSQNSGNVDYYSVIDWETGRLLINLETDFPPGTDSLQLRTFTENFFKKNFFDIFIDSIKSDINGVVYYDSMNTVEESIRENPSILSRIDEIGRNALRIYSTFSNDMSNMRIQYKLDIYRDAAAHFVTHRYPERAEKTLSWVSSADFTGVVIYAAGEYPVHGETAAARLNRAFFPAVYDINMRRVLHEKMVDPEVISLQGPVTYLSDPDSEKIRKYAGDRPMFTMARKIFGRYRTDILIPSEAADKLFYNGRNISLAEEGRFVIITTPPSERP